MTTWTPLSILTVYRLTRGDDMRDIRYESDVMDYTVHTDRLQERQDLAQQHHDKPLFDHIDQLHIHLAMARSFSRLIEARARLLEGKVPA